MSEHFNQWKSGSDVSLRVKRHTNRSSKLSFWRKDSYKSAKLKSDYDETEKLYTFDNPYYGPNVEIEDFDVSQHTSNDTSFKSKNYFELKNRNIYQNNELSCDESNKQDLELNRNESLIEYLNYEIQEKDTLRSIALRYGCSVSKIKQINHLITDQEFYGLRVLKLPVKKFGILSDVLIHQVNNSHNTHDSDIIDFDSDITTDTHKSEPLEVRKPRTNSLTVNIGISQHLSRTNSDDAFRFLNHMDEDLKKIRESTKTVIESSNVKSLDQNLVSLNSSDFTTLESSKLRRSAFLSCDESDYGINWCNLLLLAFVLLILVPLIYVVYISETHNTTISNVHINH